MNQMSAMHVLVRFSQRCHRPVLLQKLVPGQTVISVGCGTIEQDFTFGALV